MAIEQRNIKKAFGFGFGLMLGLALQTGECAPAQAPIPIQAGEPAGANAGQLNIDPLVYQLAEAETDLTLTVTRSGGSAGLVSVDFSSCCGTATPGADYEASSGVLSWDDGDAAPKTIVVHVHDDMEAERLESFIVQLQNPSGGALIANGSGVVFIDDNDFATHGRIEFQPGFYQLGETETVLELTVVREEGNAGPASVTYSSCCGIATPGMDYDAVSGTLFWADGDGTPKTILVPIHDDSEAEAIESFLVNLNDVTGGAIINDNAAAAVQIDDDDVPAHGRIEFQPIYYRLGETETMLELTVVREEANAGPISVDYSSCCGTATPGMDYEAVAGTLFWADGDGAPKSIFIPIHDDSEPELGETFLVGLSEVTGGAIIGDNATGVVWIDDDETDGVFADGFENQP